MGNGVSITINYAEPETEAEAKKILQELNAHLRRVENSGLEADVKIKQINELRAYINRIDKKLYELTHRSSIQPQNSLGGPKKAPQISDNTPRQRTETKKICRFCHEPFYRSKVCSHRRNGNPCVE